MNVVDGGRDGEATMSCTVWQEALSARADGESEPIDERLLERHLRRCSSCRHYAAALGGAAPLGLVEVGADGGSSAPTADVVAAAVRGVRRADRAGWTTPRTLLVVVAVQVIVFAAIELMATGDDAHEQRHLGAFAVAYGVGLLGVVWRPARARTMLPVAVVLAVALAITSVVDVWRGDAPLSGEALHLAELASVGLVWWMAVPAHRRPTAPA